MCIRDSHYQPQGISSPKMLSYPVQVVYLHGGGFVVGDLDSHDDLCAEMADICGFNLVSVAYRLAPEHQYPCDISDCLALVDHLIHRGKAIILVGDSAGATLAACVANARSSYTGTQLLGQVLIYPALANDASTSSMHEHAHAPLLTKEEMTFIEKFSPYITGNNLRQFTDTMDSAYYGLERNASSKMLFTEMSFQVMRYIHRA